VTTYQLKQQHGKAFRQRETGAWAQSVDQADDYAEACYGEPLPDIPASKEIRTIPWGTREIGKREGEGSCCSSLDEVRRGIDIVDEQLLQLLAKRYVNDLCLDFDINIAIRSLT
jgi:hypothetical protein